MAERKNNKRNSRMPRKNKKRFFFFVNEEILNVVAPFYGRDKAEEANNAEVS